MSKFEVFDDEGQLFRRIDQLRIDDIKDEDITIVAADKLDRQSIIDTYTSVNFKKSHGTLWDRFASKFGEDDSNGRVRNQLNLAEDEKIKYDNALDAGSILLFVDGLTHTEEADEDETDEMAKSDNEPAEDVEDTQDSTDEISDDDEKESEEVIETADRQLVKKDYDGITANTETEDTSQPAVNKIKTDEDTHHVDMSTYVTQYDKELELEEEEVQHAKVDEVIEEKEEKNLYHTVKDNVVNMNPEEDESGIKQG